MFIEIIPKGLFPIAREDAGSLICISLEFDKLGEVYYWNYHGETRPPSYDNVYQIAGTFQGFLESLHHRFPLAEEEEARRGLPH